ncbi:hypothetical protein MHYP_G00228470 [Metynnis hypsauchen]
MQSVRPKRRPAYMQDYEVAMAGSKEIFPAVNAIQHLPHHPPDQSLAGADASPIAITELSSVSRPSHQRWNITIDEWHLSPEQSIRQADSVTGSSSPFLVSREPFQAMYQAQMDEIHRENVKLHKTQCAVRADIARLHAAKEDLVILMEKACHLTRSGSFLDSEPVHQQQSMTDDEEWPAPPPWISPDVETSADAYEPPAPSHKGVNPATSTPKVVNSDGHPREVEKIVPLNPNAVSPVLRHLSSEAPQLSSRPTAHTLGHTTWPVHNPSGVERYYRGPQPTIPYFRNKDPSEFARLKMALDNLLPPDSTELFKYQVLVDHLKIEEACLIADSYLHSSTPYTDTILALHERFGQPHQIALQRIAHIMDLPDVQDGHPSAFEKFSLQVQSLVGMLRTLGPEGSVELQCGSHVARLLNKLPPNRRADFRRHLLHHPKTAYTLEGLAGWLKHEAWCQDYESEHTRREKWSKPVLQGIQRHKHTTATGQCPAFQTLTKDQVANWIRQNRRCWRCGRLHQAAQCDLQKPCSLCKRRHLRILHEVNDRPQRESCLVNTPTQLLYLNKPVSNTRVLLKVVRVLLHCGECTLDTFAILDDGSERTILLPEATRRLGLKGTPESLTLRTIRHDIQMLHGSSVSFQISSFSQPQRRYQVSQAFTASQLALVDHSYPVCKLQAQYRHLSGLPLQPFERAKPLLLVGADHPHLITPIEPVKLGPPGGPAAVHTRLGWTLQGPTRLVEQGLSPQQCLHTSVIPDAAELFQCVEKLWRVDTVPFHREQDCTRSRQDHDAMEMLETKTVRIEVEGTHRYATPLLRKRDMPLLRSSETAVLPRLRSLERKLVRDPQSAAAYSAEIQKLLLSGSVVKLKERPPDEGESWFIPHHMVSHNAKNRIVFDCSFQSGGISLNDALLPGPSLGSSLLGVLLRFREHAVAISGDVRAMFHQVRLLSEDSPLLRFIWRDLRREDPPDIYEWRVLPFGTTCSPCCAIYALQRHVKENSQPGEDVRLSVERSFYVDNCLQSLPSAEEARQLIDKLRALLARGGFELRQWSSNVQSVTSHLPIEARSGSSEQWLAHEKTEAGEGALGLSWNCPSDMLTYKSRVMSHGPATMRVIYKVLASQYDPLGYILPFVTRAKVLVQRLWGKRRGWDDPLLPGDLLQSWNRWEEELSVLPEIHLPRAYVPLSVNQAEVTRELHIFCDASESAYGAVAYLRTAESSGATHLSFVMARSRVAPKRMLSIPRLELCAAVSGAQLAQLLQKELTLQIHGRFCWSDSTTVLAWIKSESCRFKVFVGTRIAEIHEITDVSDWRYVDSELNPADDITRGKTLMELSKPSRWTQGPQFLLQDAESWPAAPDMSHELDSSELRRSVFCGAVTSAELSYQQFKSWEELIESVVQKQHGAASSGDVPTAEDYKRAEMFILQRTQQECFGEDLTRLKAGKPLLCNSRLLTLAPSLDEGSDLIRVGGRLRRAKELDTAIVHPVVLDSTHPAVRLLIQKYDQRLHHPGAERVYAEMRRRFWILRSREAIRRHQRTCVECQRWRAKPAVPKMADLPEARLRLFKPVFYSTGTDCFGPLLVKVGRRLEKRWGILFKCLTTKAIHIEILHSLSTDSFLMSLRRFIARRGIPKELWSDQGTNFKGGEKEIEVAFKAMSPDLQCLLAKQQIAFNFNPPAAPHFGGVWEREVRSIKEALYKTIGAQPIQEEILQTVLLEVENILNSRPLGYVSSDIADADPVTPNLLLMGRLDSALPQVIYPQSVNFSQRKWRHAQILADQFWSAFIRHYLPSLQARVKWFKSLPGIPVGAVVLVVDPQQPRAQWPIGKVVKVHPSRDGQVRSLDDPKEGLY